MTTTDRELVDVACKIDKGLTEWEAGFVDSCARQVLDKQRPLSTKQRVLLEMIIEKEPTADTDDD